MASFAEFGESRPTPQHVGCGAPRKRIKRARAPASNEHLHQRHASTTMLEKPRQNFAFDSHLLRAQKQVELR